jgi:hypothetical protein
LIDEVPHGTLSHNYFYKLDNEVPLILEPLHRFFNSPKARFDRKRRASYTSQNPKSMLVPHAMKLFERGIAFPSSTSREIDQRGYDFKNIQSIRVGSEIFFRALSGTQYT